LYTAHLLKETWNFRPSVWVINICATCLLDPVYNVTFADHEMPEIKRPLKVFLYHAPIDKIAVRDLYLRLIKDGVDTWLVKEKILPSQDWKQEIHKAIYEADVVVVCVSRRFDQLESRQKEVRAALDSTIEQLDGGISVIPVRLEQCERLEKLRKWQWVDLFEEAGYEMLMRALQAQADEIGAIIQPKEGSLPQITTPGVKHERPDPEENPAQVRQALLESVEGTGVLIDGPAVKLRRPTLPRKLKRAMMLALIGLAGIVVTVMLRSPQFQRWYQLAMIPLDMTQTPTPAPSTQVRLIATLQMRPLPTLVGKGKVSHIVFLIDTSGSMQGQRIRMVESAVSEFVSRLSGDELVSIIEFNTNVELRMAAAGDHAAVSESIRSIGVGVLHNGSCIRDAMYAAIQQTSLGRVEEDAETMIILLTDVALGESVGWSCSLRVAEDFYNLTWNDPVPVFSIYVGDDFDVNTFSDWTWGIEGATLEANTEKEIDNTFAAISNAAGLELNDESAIPAPTTDARQVSMVFVPAGEFMMGSNMVYLDSFWIDKIEVTNGMYAQCVQAGKCSPPRSSRSNTREPYYGTAEFDHYPVIYVSWVDAQNYCRWAGGRLPTESEWEKAARGTDGRQYPWGDEDPLSVIGLLNFHAQDTTEVGSFPDGASPYGALDMAGNVSEWVADWLSLDYYNSPPMSNPLGPDSGEYRVWRGGSWANTSTERVRTYSRTGNFPTDSSSGIGFRCARDASP
jgi:formylglycine-generating enzyme required for sulfatase activity